MSTVFDRLKQTLVTYAGANPITTDLVHQVCTLEQELVTAVKAKLPAAKLQEVQARVQACIDEAEQHLQNFDAVGAMETALAQAKDRLRQAAEQELQTLLASKLQAGWLSAFLDRLVYQVKVLFGLVK